MNRIFAILITMTALCACDDSLDGAIDRIEVEVNIITSDATVASKSDEAIEFRNIASGRMSKFEAGEPVMLVTGMYDVSYTASAVLDNGAKSMIRANASSVIIDKSHNSVTLTTYCMVENDDLIISEIFFAGTLQPSGNQYYGDDYVKLYNNTDHVIYADGITFFETKFLTTEKRVYTPDVMATDVTVQALYTIPGSGKDHPVEPGEYLLLADTGIDHRVANPNSFDLSGADFEWYDQSTTPSTMDIDGPTVDNLDKWYCYTLSIFLLHNRGFKAYGIARIPIDRDTYLKDYRYDFDYEIVSEVGTFPMSGNAYRLPNEWVADIVNCSVASQYAWNLCAPALDSGWTYCGTMDKDKTRYFKAVRRKLLYINDKGNPVYKDTNNSSVDFNPEVTPSEIEIQHTAIDVDGNAAERITYDGVTPIK